MLLNGMEVKLKSSKMRFSMSPEAKSAPPGQPQSAAKKKQQSKESMLVPTLKLLQHLFICLLHIISCVCVEQTCVVLTWSAENKALGHSVENLFDGFAKESRAHSSTRAPKQRTGKVHKDQHPNRLNILLLKLMLVFLFLLKKPENLH